MKFFTFIFLCLLFLNCNKEENPDEFNFIDIEDASGIFIARNNSESDTTLKLYKLNNSDNLSPVKFLNKDKNEVVINLKPIEFYNLNSLYFLLNLTEDNISVQSYLIRKFDGLAKKLTKPVVARHLNSSVEAIKADRKNNFYFVNTEGNWKLYLNDNNNLVTEKILEGQEISHTFSVDELGNLLSENKLFTVNGIEYSLKYGTGFSRYPVKSFVNQMYYLFRNGDSLQISRVNAFSDDISETLLYPSVKNNSGTVFLNSLKISDKNKIVIALNTSLMVIGKDIKTYEPRYFNLSKILDAKCSKSYAYIYGENSIQEKVFVKIDFGSSVPLYTQIFAPGEMEIHHFFVSDDNNILFSGRRILDA